MRDTLLGFHCALKESKERLASRQTYDALVQDMLFNLLDEGPSPTYRQARSRVVVPLQADLLLHTGNSLRLPEDFLPLIRSRAPGLRHIHNKHLQARPELEGRMTVRLTLLASGECAKAELLSSDMGAVAFEAEVLKALQKWSVKARPGPEGVATLEFPLVFLLAPLEQGKK